MRSIDFVDSVFFGSNLYIRLVYDDVEVYIEDINFGVVFDIKVNVFFDIEIEVIGLGEVFREWVSIKFLVGIK